MSTIASEFTKEQLQQIIETDHVQCGEASALARIALASLEAEPAIHRWRRVTVEPYGPYPWHYGNFIGFSQPVDGIEDEYFYSVPPAPVSDSLLSELLGIAKRAADEADECAHAEFSDDSMAHSAAIADWERRAVMLQGAEPVTTAYKLPANTPCKDAPEHIWLQTAGVWPENGEFSELTWCSDNQHKDDTLYVRADVVTGNSPVIPDGWVMVPEDPTHEMLEAGDEQFGTYDVYRRMIAASPQQK